MKLASYRWTRSEQTETHVGFCANGRLYSLIAISDGAAEYGVGSFTDLIGFLEQGADALRWARDIEYAVTMGEEKWQAFSCSLDEAHLLPPVTRPEKIICIGKNYFEHAKEMEGKVPAEPLFFTKFISALSGANDAIILPPVSQQVDYEAELAVIIGREGKYIKAEDAYNHVAGYMVFNDVSARDWQYRTGQFTAGKTFDTFASCGPFLVTRDEAPDPQALSIKLTLNDEVRQEANTSQMIFTIPVLIAYLSQLFALKPGDIISTGTPAGVGHARKPPSYLQAGDKIKIEIEQIGVLENRVEAERG